MASHSNALWLINFLEILHDTVCVTCIYEMVVALNSWKKSA